MTKLTATLAFAALLALAASADAAGPAPAAPPAPPIVVDIELRDAGATAAASRTIALTLGLARIGDCAAAELADAGRAYQVDLCRSDADGTLALTVAREDHSGAAVATRKLRVTSRVAPGARTVVARADQSPGGLEVAVTVR